LTLPKIDFIVLLLHETVLVHSGSVGFKGGSQESPFLFPVAANFYFTLDYLKKKTASVPTRKTQARVFGTKAVSKF